MKNSLLLTVINETETLLKNNDFLNRHRLGKKDFTRHRKWSFEIIVLFVLNFLKQSLQVEINRFNKMVNSASHSITKSAFSKARKKISYLAFKELFLLSSQIWCELGLFERFNGYRIFAIDGSVIQLPKNSSKWLSEFGILGNQHGYSSIRARASILCDVLTGVIIHAEFDSMSVGERCMADKHLAYFKSYSSKKDIIIFDRGYPSHELIASLENSGISYLMRIPKRFIPVLDSSLEHDIMHVIYFEKQYYSVRAIKVQLPTGEIERLITNLPHEDFSHNDFLALYFLRWPIESKYNTIKNKLFLETFSGKTAIAIKQDFYATMYLANLTAFAKYESDSLIKEKTVGKFSKYTYKANENVLIGLLKTNFITIFYSKSQYIKKKKIRLLIEQSSTFIIAERPGRHYDRPQKKNKWINNCVNKAKTAL